MRMMRSDVKFCVNEDLNHRRW